MTSHITEINMVTLTRGQYDELMETSRLRDEIVALVGDHVFDHTEWDTGVRKCRQHAAAGYQATCPQAWLRENLPSVFAPNRG